MLLAIGQFKADVFEAIRERFGAKTRFFVPRAVLKEMEVLAKKKRFEGLVAIALKAMERNCVKVVDVKAIDADAALLHLAGQGYFVASNDRALRKKIKKVGGKNIYLRKKKLIEIE